MLQQRKAVVRTVVVEDEDLYRNMLVSMLNQEPQISVVGEFDTAAAALAQIPKLRPDVAVVDISLGPGINGIQLGMQLRTHLHDLGIVLLSSTMKPSLLRSLPDRSLSGWSYLHKKSLYRMETLVRAIMKTADGLMVLDPSITSGTENQPAALLSLVPGQVAILRLMAQGYSDDEIAAKADLPPERVVAEAHAIFDRLGIDWESGGTQPRVKAVLYYLKEVAIDL